MNATRYVHGYSSREAARLTDQANTLSDLLHHDTVFAPGSLVLECGCGTGAQTVHLASRNPAARIISVDVSETSLDQARQRITAAGLRNVEFRVADIFNLPFADAQFDHVFLCFVLEHISAPVAALGAVKRVLRRGGTLTTIEGDHGSWYCNPPSPEASRAVQCLIDIQARLGGDSLIGRRLYPLLTEAGFREVQVSPRMVYVDSSRPNLVEGFSKKYVHRHGGRRARTGPLSRPDRSTHLGEGNCRPLPRHRVRRHLLLHLFQSHRFPLIQRPP